MEEKQFNRFSWEEYQSMLERFNYTPEQILEVKTKRESLDLMPWEMYEELLKQGVLVHTRKLKKKRSLYVCEEGKVWYLNHFNKRYEYVSYFKQEE